MGETNHIKRTQSVSILIGCDRKSHWASILALRIVALPAQIEAPWVRLGPERLVVMKTIRLDCQVVLTEGDFWDLYLAATQPRGAGVFGRSIQALQSALTHGEAGWPGECELKLVNTQRLKSLRGGLFYEQLLRIAGNTRNVRMDLE